MRGKRPLNSDELGEKGELAFAGMCVDASLISNKANRDRTGWDYIIEFAFPEPARFTMLDSRPQPVECRVQIKTVWTGASSVKFRLSSAERLAKARQPAFIFVLECGNDLKLQALYGLQVTDEVLSRILREVRQCQAEGSIKINQKTISIPYKSLGKLLRPSGDAIRNYIQVSVGEDQDAYLLRKLDQMKNLGVTGGRYSGKFTIEAESEVEIHDVLLGLKRGKLSQINVDEVRWGIRLPVQGSLEGPGEVLFSPKPMRGEIVMRSLRIGQKAHVHVDIYMAPMSPSSSNYRKVRMSNSLFEMIFEWIGEGIVQMRLTPTTASGDDVVLTLEEHMKLNLVQQVLCSGDGIMQVLHNRKPIIGPSEFAPGATGAEAEGIASRAEMFRKLKSIVSAAGDREIKISIADIISNYNQVNFVCDLIERPQNVRLSPAVVTAKADVPDIPDTEALVIGKMDFASCAIAYSATADVAISRSEGSMIFKTDNLQPRQIELIDLGQEEFDAFAQQMQDELGLRLVIKPGDVTIADE